MGHGLAIARQGFVRTYAKFPQRHYS